MAGRALRALSEQWIWMPSIEGGEGALLADGVEAEGEQVGEQSGVRTVEQIADAVVAGDGLHLALEREVSSAYRRRRVALVGAATGIGQARGGLAEAVQEGIENGGHIVSSKAAPAKYSN